jgi:hypothetical protein
MPDPEHSSEMKLLKAASYSAWIAEEEPALGFGCAASILPRF